MRLIDADKVFEFMKSKIDMQDVYLPIHFMDMVIDEMPTAYDVDKVVEEIKEATFGVDVTYTDSEDVVESEEAIRIIRKGGVE